MKAYVLLAGPEIFLVLQEVSFFDKVLAVYDKERYAEHESANVHTASILKVSSL